MRSDEIEGAFKAFFMFAGVTGEVDSDRLYEYAGEALSTEVVDWLVEANPAFEAIGKGKSSTE